MFSYIIDNPNKFEIKDDYFIIPFGVRCTSAIACKYANIRKFSLPFDWSIPLFPKKIKNVLENNFDNFVPDVHNGIFYNIYNFYVTHFNPDINTGIEEYKRRINRFNDIINQSKKIYFVYINEDYLYDVEYRQDQFNDNIFNDFLELEKYIKDRYKNIDYNILYFNFKKNTIPIDSNIINIILQTSTIYDILHEAPFEEFRKFCGKILSELFNTTLISSYTEDIFYN